MRNILFQTEWYFIPFGIAAQQFILHFCYSEKNNIFNDSKTQHVYEEKSISQALPDSYGCPYCLFLQN